MRILFWALCVFSLQLSACIGDRTPGNRTTTPKAPETTSQEWETGIEAREFSDDGFLIPTTGWELVGEITHTAVYPMTDGGVQLVDEAPVLLEKNGEFLRVREFVFHGTADMVEPERFEFINGRDASETSLHYRRPQGGTIPLSVIER